MRSVGSLVPEFLVETGAVSSSSSEYERVEIESDHEPEPPCTMVDCQGGDVFDIPAIARRRGWDEHELTHMEFEFGEQEGMRRMEEVSLEDDAL